MLTRTLEHVKWFTDPAAHPTRYDLLLSLPVLVALALAAGAVVTAWLFERRFPEPRTVKVLERFAGWGPTALGLHLGLALIVAAIFGFLFVPAPTLHLEAEGYGFALLVIEAMCGLMILLGLATRAAAVLLALLGILAMVPFTFESILEQVHILGIAAFLFLIGRGRLSLDRIRGVQPPVRWTVVPAGALALVRVAMGFAILFGALTEKLLNPALAVSLLAERPFLNVVAPLGVSDGQFVWLAGVTELLIGAVILSPWVTRPAIVVGAAIFTASLPLFGWAELLGHLPFYGVMLLLLIAPKADSAVVRRKLRPQA